MDSRPARASARPFGAGMSPSETSAPPRTRADVAEQLIVPTKQRLERAAQELIEEGGYSAASVAAIAERAGVAAGTLYRHFPSKQDLFVEVFRSVCAREERAMRAAAENGGSSGGAVRRLEDVFATFAQRA